MSSGFSLGDLSGVCAVDVYFVDVEVFFVGGVEREEDSLCIEGQVGSPECSVERGGGH